MMCVLKAAGSFFVLSDLFPGPSPESAAMIEKVWQDWTSE